MKIFAQRVVCFFMVLSILNTSVDVPDNLLYRHLSKSKVSAANEVESIVEFVAEFVLNTDIKFNEQRNDDNDGNHLAKKFSSLKFQQGIADLSLLSSSIRFQSFTHLQEGEVYKGYVREITPPPPQFG